VVRGLRFALAGETLSQAAAVLVVIGRVMIVVATV